MSKFGGGGGGGGAGSYGQQSSGSVGGGYGGGQSGKFRFVSLLVGAGCFEYVRGWDMVARRHRNWNETVQGHRSLDVGRILKQCVVSRRERA